VLSLEVADLAGIRHPKEMGKEEFQVVARLQSVNQRRVREAGRPRMQCVVRCGLGFRTHKGWP
jgi:hypothetical protein